MSPHPDWIRAPGVRADRVIRTRPDGWHLIVERLPSGPWIAAAHRGSPDDWASLGRHPTEAEALAAADGWDPGDAARKRPAAAVRAPEPEPEPDEDTTEDAAPRPAVALPGQLALNFGGV